MNEHTHYQVREANRNFYDYFADKYESLERSVFHPRRQEQLEERIRTLCKETGGGTVLDIGCGTGNVSKFARKYSEMVVGVDISIEALKINKTRTGINAIQGDGLSLPFADNTFDAITCFSVLHHFLDDGSLLKELNRVLKPGGILFTDNDPNFYFFKYFGWRSKMRLFFNRKRLLNNNISPEQLEIMNLAEYHADEGLKPEALEGIMKGAGFSQIEMFFYFHPNPDRFTRFLKVLASIYDFRGLYNLFYVHARK
jgi:ubiquinone/menaquinone biosynthesis C-methylase UbiE